MPSETAPNMVVCQSGGPTAVINQSLVGAVIEARKHKQIANVYGAMHGVAGLLTGEFIDLTHESVANLEIVADTPSSALGSARMKPTAADCGKIFKVLKKYDIGYFFYIGGNDSAENAYIINEQAKAERFPLHCFHVPKTIDNDLRENDHTPGYASAAKFVACAVMGDDLDNRALPGVKIDVIMGRDAGFLTAAAALGRRHEDDGPHLIYLPERPFAASRFVRDVKAVYKRLGRCVIAVSEGIVDHHGVPIAKKFSKETDEYGNVQLSGSGALGDLLANEIRKKTNISRVRADTFGYLQRSFPGVVSERDAREARAVGVAAVREAAKGHRTGSIAIRRRQGRNYRIHLECVPLKKVARDTRHVPDRFINSDCNNVTKAFLNYAKPMVGPLPLIGRLAGRRVELD
jgi:6-phosphofructokinase